MDHLPDGENAVVLNLDWDPRRAPGLPWWQIKARLRRRRQCDIRPHFASLLTAQPDLEARWRRAPVLVRNTYNIWMEAPWRAKERRRRAAMTLAYLKDDRLREAIQKVSWVDALSTIDFD